MSLTPRTRLGRYEILAPLGAGGMGEVYRAHDARLGRDVAIKVLPDAVAADPERLARFEREARTVAGLNHPNIVVLHSIEEVAGTRFLTMELVDGRGLDSIVAPGGVPLPRLLEIAIALADALVAAHEKGVIHRDLKPANVMLTGDGRVKVLDFGLARLASARRDTELTQAATVATPLSEAGLVAGTVPYMAPEQVRGEAVDARADLFAFGVLLFELAAGRRPFTGATPADVSSAILRDDPPALASARPDLPEDFERIIGRCLAKSARERFQTALDVANELRALRRRLESSASQLAPADRSTVASIAVVPFLNRSANAEDEYFSDGLADELINVLARIRGLRVAARTSAFHFKGKDATIAGIGAALKVATVLEGSVRKAGNRVRIAVQLVNVADGYHLWSETYDRTLEDIFAVQEEIAQAVVKELRATLLGEHADSRTSGEVRAEVGRAVAGRRTDPEAHRLYLLARHFGERVTRDDSLRAREHLRAALERDPEYALAWAELGLVYWRAGGAAWLPSAEAYASARDAAERTLRLAPDLAEGHMVMALVHLSADWDWRAAQASMLRARELAPGDARVLSRSGTVAMHVGRFEEAVALHRAAIEKDPLSAAFYSNLGTTLGNAGRLDEAESALRRALELAPQRIVTRSTLALVLLRKGRPEEALAEAAKEPSDAFRSLALAIIHHEAGRRAESDAALQVLVAMEDDFAAQIAEVHAARGEADAAFAWLERAWAARDPGITETRFDPSFRSLHGDPRWAELMRRLGYEWEPTSGS